MKRKINTSFFYKKIIYLIIKEKNYDRINNGGNKLC